MEKSERHLHNSTEGSASDDHAAFAHDMGEHPDAGGDELAEAAMNEDKTFMTTAATVGVVAVAAVVFEAALIPGIALGVAAALAPSYMPRLGAALNPIFRSTIRSAYKLGRKTREAASEVKEQMNDIVAEVHAEGSDLDDAIEKTAKPKDVKSVKAAA